MILSGIKSVFKIMGKYLMFYFGVYIFYSAKCRKKENTGNEICPQEVALIYFLTNCFNFLS